MEEVRRYIDDRANTTLSQVNECPNEDKNVIDLLSALERQQTMGIIQFGE